MTNNKIDHTDPEVLQELYHEKRMTISEIVERSSVTYSTVVHWMDKHGIERRERGAGHKYDEKPWRNKEKLRRLHIENEETVPEIAEEWSCSAETVSDWLRKHGIKNRTREIKKKRHAWDNPGQLRELYHQEEKSLQEVADILDCERHQVRQQMEYYGIKRRGRLETIQSDHAQFKTGVRGYEAWSSGTDFLRVHRLLAIADGYDCKKVFSGEFAVHHRNGIPWDNRPENIELLSLGDHARLHHTKMTGS